MYVRDSSQHPGRIICACEECGSEFLCWKNRVRKYCSRYCFGQATIIDLTGHKFFRLTVLERDSSKPFKKEVRVYWLCLCTCGTKISVRGKDLKNGRIKSCGCFYRERRKYCHRTHGMSRRESEYTIWSNMLQRCLNTKHPSYAYYGGRGITVCTRWLTFENFYTDMGPRPSPKHSINRIDNNKGYELGNVEWATPVIQANNSRKNHYLTYKGKTFSVAEWSRILEINKGTLSSRIRYGWTVEEILTTPVRKR